MKDFLLKHKWPLIVCGVAFLARLVYLIELSLQPGFDVPMIDEKWHWEWAHSVLDGSFWGEGAYFRAPLYPYLLAFLSIIGGGSVFWCKVLQSLLACGTVFFLYRLTEKIFTRAAAIAAGLVYALYAPLVFYETMFLIPAVFLFFLVWGMYRVVVYREENSWKSWLATGLIFGLAAISRPNVLLVVPFLMLWLFWIRDADGVFSKRARLPLVLALGTLLAVAPVTIRNYVVTGDLILISSQGGVNLYLGNNPKADGLTMLMPEVDLDESVSWRQFGVVTKAAAEQEVGHELSEAEESAFWSGKAAEWITSNPGQFLKLVGKKTVYLMSGFENSDNLNIYHQRSRSGLIAALLWKWPIYFPFGLLVPLFAVGVYAMRKRWKDLLPLYIFILAYTPSIVLFLVTARHRLPLIPFMILIAVGGVATLVSRGRKLKPKEIAIAATLLLAPLLIFNRTYFDEGATGNFQFHFNNGIRFEQTGDYANAEKEYLLADAAYPYSAPLLNNLAFSQFKLGKHAEADRNYHRALGVEPDFAPVLNNLGLLALETGGADSAVVLYRRAARSYDPAVTPPEDIGQVYLNMATAWESLGWSDSAAAAFERALTAAPQYPRAYLKAAAFHARSGAHTLADHHFEQAREITELSGSDLFNWGLSYLQRRMFRESAAMMRLAVDTDETLHQAWYCLAVSYTESGQSSDSAMSYLDRCLELNPGFRQAQELRARLDAGR